MGTERFPGWVVMTCIFGCWCAVNAEMVGVSFVTLLAVDAMLFKRWRKELRLPGPPGSVLRGKDSKPLQGALVKSQGLERCSKRRRNLRQVCTTKMSVSEPSNDASKENKDDIRTGVATSPWDEPGGWSRSWPGGVRRKGGMSVVLAFERNSGTSRVVVSLVTEGTGVRRGRKPKARVPDAAHWGGLGCSSDEGPVMGLEQRPQALSWNVRPIW
jgi:hypothetical protein